MAVGVRGLAFFFHRKAVRGQPKPFPWLQGNASRWHRREAKETWQLKLILAEARCSTSEDLFKVLNGSSSPHASTIKIRLYARR
jgi:hypothetical protein